MTGEELNRRYHELCGWLIALDGKGSPPAKYHCESCQLSARKDLPPLHLDANLAIAEADLAFLNSDGKPDYTLARNRNGWHVERFIQTPTNYGRQMWFDGSLCEAILKALIAARSAQ